MPLGPKFGNLHFLKEPYPINESFAQKLGGCFISGLFVYLFLFMLRPFGINGSPVQNLDLYLAGFGLVTFLISIITTVIIPLIFPPYFEETGWTTGKNILYSTSAIIIIGFANLYYSNLMTKLEVSILEFFNYQFYTIAVTFFLTSVTTFFRYNSNLSFYMRNASEMNRDLAATIGHQALLEDKSIFTIKADNDKEVLNFTADNLLYIEAADNYCKFFILTDKTIAQKMLRVSLKNIEEQLPSNLFFRCHRSYIINLKMIKEIQGNSQGYKISLQNLSQTLPVSRNSGKKLSAQVTDIYQPFAPKT